MLNSNYYYGTTSHAALMGGVSYPLSYNVNGSEPYFISDFAGVNNNGTEYYKQNGTEVAFSDVWTHSRSSNATMTDSDGYIKLAPHNRALRSEEFDNAAWTKANSSITANAAVDPDGGSTADKLVANSGTATHYMFNATGLTPSAADRHTAGVFAKAAEWDQVVVGIYDGTAANYNLCRIDLTDGSVLQENTANQTVVTDAGSGWYHIDISRTLTGTAASYVAVTPWDSSLGALGSTTAQPSFAGDGSSGIYIWGARWFRSSLGGMVDNPDRGDSYVPTTTAAVYLPRRNHYRYNGSGYVNKGVQIESEARTNLVLYSSNFENAHWTEQAVATISAGAASDPAGTSTACIMTASSGSAQHVVYNAAMTTTSGSNAASSVYVRKGTHRYVYLNSGLNTEDFICAVFDLDGGGTSATETDVGTTSGTIAATHQEDVGNGWFRLTIVGSVTTATRNIGVGFASAATGNTFGTYGNITYNAAGTETFYVWGAQHEIGSTPSSYIPTSGATVTRAAETFTMAGSELSYNASAMTIQVQGFMNYSDTNSGGNMALFMAEEASATTGKWGVFVDSDRGTGGLNYYSLNNSTQSFRIEGNGSEFSPGTNVAVNCCMTVTHSGGTSYIDAASGGVSETQASISGDFIPEVDVGTFRLADDTTMSERAGFVVQMIRQWDVDIGSTGREEATA